jgi:hypothetical protein
MRRAITLILYLVMIGVGAWATFEWLMLGGRGIALRLGLFPGPFGAYLLWADFVSPSGERL